VTTGEGVSNHEHLAEMDRLLREIQVELSPEREPAPALDPAPALGPAPPATPDESEPAGATPPPATDAPPATHFPSATQDDTPDPGASSGLVDAPAIDDDRAKAFSHLAARLLAAMRELLDGYEQVLARISPAPQASPTPPARQAAGPPPTRRRGDPGVTLAAGPFPSLEALSEFEQAVSRLPGVRDVAVRGYEGADRAIIEVRLDRNGG
jgi:hypothetical protein